MRVVGLAECVAATPGFLAQGLEIFVEQNVAARRLAERGDKSLVEFLRQIGDQRIDAALADAQPKALDIVGASAILLEDRDADAVLLQALRQCQATGTSANDSDFDMFGDHGVAHPTALSLGLTAATAGGSATWPAAWRLSAALAAIVRIIWFCGACERAVSVSRW